MTAKIVKGERRGKRKSKINSLPMPSRILSYPKIVKGERRGKRKSKINSLPMPSRILSYLKIVKGERRGKRNTLFSTRLIEFDLTNPHPILWGRLKTTDNLFQRFAPDIQKP